MVKKPAAMEAKEEMPVVEKKKHDPSEDIVEIDCFCPIMINGKEHFGTVKVKRLEAESILEMLSKKKASDARIHIGKEFERTKVDGQLVIRDAHTKRRVEA